MATSDMRLPTVSHALLIELGGATFDLLGPLADSGTMPHVAELLRTSALARLRLETTPSEAVAWATLECGGGPEMHGLLDDWHFDHHQGRLLPAGARSVPCPTLGEMVAAADPALPKTPVARAACGRRIWARRPSTFAELSWGIARTEDALRSATASAWQIDHSQPWRLLAVRFGEIAPLLYRLWHATGVGGSAGANRQWVAKTREAFRTLDLCLGSLLTLADRRSAAVVLVSPFGFAPFRERITVCELLGRRGLLAAAPSHRKVCHGLARRVGRIARRVLPGVVRRPMDGLAGVDLRRSRAVCLHGQSAALVYLNTPERFAARAFPGGHWREQASADLLGAFAEARHPLSDERLFEEVYLTAARFDCDPIARCWPDLVAIPAAGFRARPRADRHGRLLRCDASLTATPTGDGLLMVRAPQVALGQPHTAKVADVAPTVLTLLGIDPPRFTGTAATLPWASASATRRSCTSEPSRG